MTNFCNFVKLDAYNYYAPSTIVTIYININYIISIDQVVENDETLYIVTTMEKIYRITEESYKWLVNLLYGKGWKNG